MLSLPRKIDGDYVARLIIAYNRLTILPDKIVLYKLRDKVRGLRMIVAMDSILFLSVSGY